MITHWMINQYFFYVKIVKKFLIAYCLNYYFNLNSPEYSL